MKRPAIAALAALAAAGCATTPTCEPVDLDPVASPESPIRFVGDPPRNVLMISIDTLRKDHLGAYGALGLTPFLDGWAASGVVFDDHQQCSNWTQHSGACTMHGREPEDIGHVPRLVEKNTPIPEGSPTLASTLGQAGYYTALASGNSFMSPEWGTATGYSEWSLQPWGIGAGQWGVDHLTAAVASGAADGGWFLHLHFMEPHMPYNPPEEHIVGLDGLEPWSWDLRTEQGIRRLKREYALMDEADRKLVMKHVTRLYQAEVRTTDARIAWTVEQLEAAGLMEDVLVVVWTDHGEQFYEHGYLTHAYELQHGENDGALFFWAENIVPGRVAAPTWGIDLAPTILDLLGVPTPEEMTGVPAGFAPEGRVRAAASAARAGVVQAVSVDGLKLHYNWSGVARLYDRASDPLETENLFDRGRDERVEPLWCSICELRPRLDRFVQRRAIDPPGLRCPEVQ